MFSLSRCTPMPFPRLDLHWDSDCGGSIRLRHNSVTNLLPGLFELTLGRRSAPVFRAHFGVADFFSVVDAIAATREGQLTELWLSCHDITGADSDHPHWSSWWNFQRG